MKWQLKFISKVQFVGNIEFWVSFQLNKYWHFGMEAEPAYNPQASVSDESGD